VTPAHSTDADFQAAILDSVDDPRRITEAIRAYYFDRDRADRTSRELLYLHVGLLCGVILRLLDDGADDLPTIRVATLAEQRAAIVHEARRQVIEGNATHDCGEWADDTGRCELCDRMVRS
jgi:hypothetical protein